MSLVPVQDLKALSRYDASSEILASVRNVEGAIKQHEKMGQTVKESCFRYASGRTYAMHLNMRSALKSTLKSLTDNIYHLKNMKSLIREYKSVVSQYEEYMGNWVTVAHYVNRLKKDSQIAQEMSTGLLSPVSMESGRFPSMATNEYRIPSTSSTKSDEPNFVYGTATAYESRESYSFNLGITPPATIASRSSTKSSSTDVTSQTVDTALTEISDFAQDNSFSFTKSSSPASAASSLYSEPASPIDEVEDPEDQHPDSFDFAPSNSTFKSPPMSFTAPIAPPGGDKLVEFQRPIFKKPPVPVKDRQARPRRRVVPGPVAIPPRSPKRASQQQEKRIERPLPSTPPPPEFGPRAPRRPPISQHHLLKEAPSNTVVKPAVSPLEEVHFSETYHHHHQQQLMPRLQQPHHLQQRRADVTLSVLINDLERELTDNWF